MQDADEDHVGVVIWIRKTFWDDLNCRASEGVVNIDIFLFETFVDLL